MQTEIQNKEKALSELMTRILQAPLDPIDKSIKTMQSDLLDTQDRLKIIDDLVVPSLTALVEDVDKTSKYSRKEFTKIQENIQALNFQFKEHMAMVSEDQRQALESVISENASQNNLSLKSTSDDIIKKLSEMTVTQRENLLSILNVRQDLIIAIESVKTAQTLQMQATLKGIQFTKEFKEKEHASLEIQIETFNKAAAAKLDTLSIDTRCSLTEQRKIKQEISEIIEFNHSATGTLLTQQHAALQEKIITIQYKLNNQTITIGLFLISILIYIGFDIFSQVN